MRVIAAPITALCVLCAGVVSGAPVHNLGYGAAPLLRRAAADPALSAASPIGAPYEWQFQATHADEVPAAVMQAAASITIAVIDTGADLTAPDLAAKTPEVFNVRSGSSDVVDERGHGTFVASLAAGSDTNREGIAGFGGGARLLVIKAAAPDGTFTDVDEANAIVYAVDHGARVINLSFGGPDTSLTEQRGIDYAVAHGVLLVAAVGNEYAEGNPAEFPASSLRSHGGLAVGASTSTGRRASFSNTGQQLSLLAPGKSVFGAVASTAPNGAFRRVPLPGSTRGRYGFASGTSFAAPQVAGAAALVMAANPSLTATGVARTLEQSASGHGSWTPERGYGVLDVAAAVALAQGRANVSLTGVRSRAGVRLTWFGKDATRFRLLVAVDGRRPQMLFASTIRTQAAAALRRGHRYTFTLTALDTHASSAFSMRG
jgi:subtilisin family serine protease